MRWPRRWPTRPDLRAFESQREMAAHSVALANADWKPSLSLIGNVAYQNDDASRLLGADNQNYTFGRGHPRAAAGGARGRGPARRRPRADAPGRTRPAMPRSTPAGSNSRRRGPTCRPTTEVVATQQKALELARESVAIAQVSYENGVITSAELNDAQVALLQTDFLLQQAKYARIVAAARARFAAGVS